MLVDDIHANLIALDGVLEPVGARKVWASSGEEALARLAEQEFALVVLDAQMPGLDGFDTLARLRERERPRPVKTPVLFVTAIYDEPKYVARAYALGAADFITKPLDPLSLRAKVGVFLELYEAREDARRHAAGERVDSEEKYRFLADTTPEIVWAEAPDGAVTYVNRRFVEYSGFERATGQGPASLLHPDDLPRYATLRSEASRGARPAAIECRLRGGEGGYRWFLSRMALRRGPGGEPREWVGTATDIDEQKRGEGLLDLLARASEALATTLRAGPALADLLRVVVPEFADWCAVQGGGVVGGPLSLASAHADLALERKLDAMLRRHRLREAAPHDHPYAARSGAPGPLAELSGDALAAIAQDAEYLAALRALGTESAVLVPLAARGREIGTIAFARGRGRRRFDPADLRAAGEIARRVSLALDNARLYEEAELARDRAEAANQAKDEFLAVVSHELRSPLNAVVGWAKLLRSGELDEERHGRAIAVIEANAGLQAKLVDDLLELGRATAAATSLRLEPLRLGDVVRAAIDATRPEAEAKGLRLGAWLGEDDGVRGDEGRLRQVVTNLLVNAVKFTPAGGRIDVRVGRKGGQIELEVSDTGRGIAPDFLPHVFERFRQAAGDRGAAPGGLGLGLAIVKGLVGQHGGSIEVHSEGEGLGASFTVSLPASAAAPERPVEPLPPSRPAPQSDARRPLGGLRLLVVEDEEDARDLMVALLGSRGAEVSASSNAPEAFELLQRLRPDVLVSDIAMPGEDGYSLVRNVRRLSPEAGGQTPALAVSAFARPEDRARAMRAGFGLYVTKPVDPAELITALLQLAGRSTDA